jgi:hypothetical protein
VLVPFLAMNRREFLGEALAVPLAGAAVLAAACGGDDGAVGVDAGPPNCLQNGTSVRVFGDHTHVMEVSVADIQAGTDHTYTLTGADHDHTALVTSIQFGLLASNQSVSLRSSVTLGHSHAISIGCKS